MPTPNRCLVRLCSERSSEVESSNNSLRVFGQMLLDLTASQSMSRFCGLSVNSSRPRTLGLLEEIDRLGCRCRNTSASLGHEDGSTLSRRERPQLELRDAAVLLKIDVEGGAICVAEPIRLPTGDSHLGWHDCEEFLDKGVDCVLIAASGPSFIERVDEEGGICRSDGGEEKVSRSKIAPAACRCGFLEQVSLAGARIAEKDEVTTVRRRRRKVAGREFRRSSGLASVRGRCGQPFRFQLAN
jgi:hypothetical protein